MLIQNISSIAADTVRSIEVASTLTPKPQLLFEYDALVRSVDGVYLGKGLGNSRLSEH